MTDEQRCPSAVCELVAAGLDLVAFWDEPDHVSVRGVRDPDGYVVEAFWEP